MAGSIHRVVKHPEHSLVLAQCEFILESFVESGELAKDGPLRYKVLPKALATLDNYDLEQRRHRTLQLLQLVGAAVAAGQLLNVTPESTLDRIVTWTQKCFWNARHLVTSAIGHIDAALWRFCDWLRSVYESVQALF